MTDIKEQKLLYHLTSMNNIESIIRDGLKSRNSLNDNEFIDVANSEILESRKSQSLENYIPFHFFAKNPFDGNVQKDHPNEKFALIAVYRSFAKEQNWKIIPCHPLSNNGEIEILDYESGFNKINWELMNQRDYSDINCKLTCMAECLSPSKVQAINFQSIKVCCLESKQIIENLKNQYNLNFYIDNEPQMFVK